MKNTSRRRVPGMPLTNNGRIKQETDHPDQEDLILFRELHKREKERNTVTLLQPVSEEFEPNGNYQLYRIASAKKGSGFEFLAENEKNDYDWCNCKGEKVRLRLTGKNKYGNGDLLSHMEK